ncbi:MAG: hypothetical protein MI802_03525 [Desulfobacterales bacterium]|nr:hypothetical protein [Desulfobacterales bacterium]
MKNSLFIRTLEFGDAAGPEGTTWHLYQQWAADNGLPGGDIAADESDTILTHYFTECFEEFKNGDASLERFILKPEHRIALMSYGKTEEVVSLVQNTGRRIYSAVILGVLAVLIFVAAGSVWVMTGVSESTEKVSEIVDTLRDDDGRRVEISRLQMAQILSAIEAGRQQKRGPAKPVLPNPTSEDSMLDAINRYYEQ